jgi:hypothetical protein
MSDGHALVCVIGVFEICDSPVCHVISPWLCR